VCAIGTFRRAEGQRSRPRFGVVVGIVVGIVGGPACVEREHDAQQDEERSSDGRDEVLRVAHSDLQRFAGHGGRTDPGFRRGGLLSLEVVQGAEPQDLGQFVEGSP